MKQKIEKKAGVPDRFRLGEMGSLGLRLFNGVSNDEIDRALMFPNNTRTFAEMSQHSTINASLSFFENLVNRATWKFNPPADATEDELKQVELINQMMQDLDHPWSEFISDLLSANIFGFAITEKVYRRRYRSNGSKYNDGVIGWKKLPIRAQESIQKFLFSDDGNEIVGVQQNVSQSLDPYGKFTKLENPIINLPINKVVHLKIGRHRGDPFGKSPLRDAYVAWKYICLLEELEATGVQKDLIGMPILYIPPQYLAKDADPEAKAIRAYYENALRNLQMNEQSAMMLPMMFDPESRQPMFKLDLLSVDGKKSYDIGKIKEYYKNMIMLSLSTDILTMGQTQAGSFALGSIKNSQSASVAFALCQNIANTVQSQLIRQTYELNGWDVSRMGTLDFENLIDADLETLSKYWQRVASTGLVEIDREVLNSIRTAVGVDPKADDEPVDKESLSGNSSRAGDGMATAGPGTSKSPSGSDTSSNNLDNSA